jgi:Type II CAAX prenyl endopeptidase Rce1-like
VSTTSEAAALDAPAAAPTFPGWARALEVAAVIGLVAHCLGLLGRREFVLELAMFSGASLVVWLLGPRMLPAPPARRAAPRALGVLGVVTLAGAGAMVTWGLTRGAWLAPALLARTLAIYLLYGTVQEYLTQRYMVVRVRAWLGNPADVWVAAAVAGLFGALHLPWPQLILPSVLAGFLWSFSYLRCGRVWPVALSHAVLAVAFFGFLVARDPFARVFGG